MGDVVDLDAWWRAWLQREWPEVYQTLLDDAEEYERAEGETGKDRER